MRTLDLPGFAAQRAALATHILKSLTRYLFPDGNVAIAQRLLVHYLIHYEEILRNEQDITLSNFDSSTLDRSDDRRRIRLNFFCCCKERVARSRVVSYVQRGRLKRVQAIHAGLACYHCMIPYFFSELALEQREPCPKT